jgi:hypothetical protein
MPGTDRYGQNVPYPKLSDTPNIETAMSTLVNGAVGLTNMTFSDANARAAAISSPVRGMETYLIAENRKDIFDGTAWRQIPTSPTWTSYSGTWSGFASFGSSQQSSRYWRYGNRVELVAEVVGGAGTNLGPGNITVNLPFPAASVGSSFFGWEGIGRFSSEDGSPWTLLTAAVSRGGSVATVYAIRASDNGWVAPGSVGNPWTVGSTMRFQVSYEAA